MIRIFIFDDSGFSNIRNSAVSVKRITNFTSWGCNILILPFTDKRSILQDIQNLSSGLERVLWTPPVKLYHLFYLLSKWVRVFINIKILCLCKNRKEMIFFQCVICNVNYKFKYINKAILFVLYSLTFNPHRILTSKKYNLHLNFFYFNN